MRMRTLGQIIILVIAAVLILPALVVGIVSFLTNATYNPPVSAPEEDLSDANPPPSTAEVTLSIFNAENSVGDNPLYLSLEEYLLGVILAEMPLSFHLEALKAQAVVARTYALYLARAGGGCGSHPGVHLCTNSRCCQAWTDPVAFSKKLSPKDGRALNEKVSEVVKQTEGQVLLFQGELAETVYHSTCGGMTEASTAVWQGCSLPYLQPVPCGFCRHSPYYRQEVVLESVTLQVLSGEGEVQPVVAGNLLPPVTVLERSPGQRVLLLRVGKKQYSGQEARNLLNLPSTYFSFSSDGDRLVFDVHGHGHGVGLCQYGADGMASSGYTYSEILSHYYPGTNLGILTATTGE